MIVIGSCIVALHETLELAADEAHSVPELRVVAYPLLHPLSLCLEVVLDLLDLLLSVGGEQYLVEVLILVPNLTVWKRKPSHQYC
jgi:hypothetical protein